MKILKLLFKTVLFALCLIGALWLIAFLTKEPSPPPSSLTLSPSKGSYRVGQTFEVKIVLKTAEEVNGADALLSFNPKVLRVVEIKEGPAFPLYPRKKADQQKGEIKITGVKAKRDGRIFTQPLTFATIVFKGKERGVAKVNFVFKKGKTTGSTIIKAVGSENILRKVTNGSYQIK